jgi:hypothetical protein
MKFTVISGHEMTFPDDVPGYDDLSDLSAHAPSGKGRKEGDVMSDGTSMEKWIAENCFLWTEHNLNQVIEIPVVSAYDLREFMKGKRIVSESDLLFIAAQTELGLMNIQPPNGVSPFVALRLALQAIRQLLHPANTVRDVEAGSGEEV